MQGARGSNPLSSTRHNASVPIDRGGRGRGAGAKPALGDGGGDQDDGERGTVASSNATGTATGGHLGRQFCLAYGESPYGYLMTPRVERAMALLRRGDRSVTEACFLVGCASLGSLSSRFTEVVGCPGAYRRQAARATAGMLSCAAKQVTRPGQESRSAAPRAAANVTAMDVTIHAGFLPHDDPSAAGQAHSYTSFIARGRSSNGRSEHEANAQEEAMPKR